MISITDKIKIFALENLGFDACTICKAEAVDEKNQTNFRKWISKHYHATMGYMERNVEKRMDPTMLVVGAKSIVMLALNYYPHELQSEHKPQIAYYAYGKDYHDVVRKRLEALYEYCQSLESTIEGRYFCDTAPLLERYWAAKSGMGWIGKNSLLIIPRRGSYFFLAALVLNTELEYDDKNTSMPDCGSCTKCTDACPTGAIVSSGSVDSYKCLSYQTIENRGDIATEVLGKMNNRFYGCDICQMACPWNRFSVAHSVSEFIPENNLLHLDMSDIESMSLETYQRIFKGSAMKRAKLEGLKRNIKALKLDYE